MRTHPNEAIANYQRKLESAESVGTCWDDYSPSVISDDDDDVSADLLEEYWATVDEYENDRECGWTDSDADNLDDRIGTTMQIRDCRTDEEPQDDESFGVGCKLISIDITGDDARIDEEIRAMNQECRVALGAAMEDISARTSKRCDRRLARIQIRRASGEINLSIHF